MKIKTRNLFTRAAKLLFDDPSIEFSCHALSDSKKLDRDASFDEKTKYLELFDCSYLSTFGFVYRTHFGVWAEPEELQEIRVLALLFASHILSEDDPQSPFVIAAENIFNRIGSEFSCVALKHAVNNGEQYPVERLFYQELFECEIHTFDRVYQRYFGDVDYYENMNELREIRVLALLFADQIFSDRNKIHLSKK